MQGAHGRASFDLSTSNKHMDCGKNHEKETLDFQVRESTAKYGMIYFKSTNDI
jgi:hypothetical protein